MKRIVLIIVIVVIIIAGFFAVKLLQTKPNVNLTLFPSPAAAKLDSQQSVHEGKLYVTPGQHTLAASFPGFANNSQTFTVKSSGITNITLVLQPNSNEGTQWLAKHPSEQKKFEALTGSAYDQDAQARRNANPITNDLPFIGPGNEYRIDYDADPSNPAGIIINITYYTDSGRQDALNWIQQQGFNPNLLKITYNDARSQYQPVNNPYTS